jgi:hypothetical protein
MKTFWSRIAGRWCKLMHPAPMWPINGYYRCPACLREHRVPWESAQPAVAARPSGGIVRAERARPTGGELARPAHSW